MPAAPGPDGLRGSGPHTSGLRTGGLLARGLLAGLAGGLVAGLVGLLVAWPALDAAVELEQAAAAAHAAAGVVHVDGVALDRGTQRVGGLAGLAAVGLVLGAGLAVGQRAVAGRRAGAAVPVFRRCLLLGAAVLAAVVVVPQLRYPALPPGVEARGGDYAGALALGVGVVAAYVLARGLARERGVLAPHAEVGLAVGAVLLTALGWVLLPDRQGSAAIPGDLLWRFRVGSLAVQTVLVLATAALLGVFLDLRERRARVAAAGQPAAGRGEADVRR